MKLGKANAVSVYIAWAMLAALMVAFPFIFLDVAISESVSKYIFGVFIISAICHIILSFFVRCPNCNKCITIQGFKAPHPNSDGSWVSVVAKWFGGSVVCIHCGQGINTHDL